MQSLCLQLHPLCNGMISKFPSADTFSMAVCRMNEIFILRGMLRFETFNHSSSCRKKRKTNHQKSTRNPPGIHQKPAKEAIHQKIMRNATWDEKIRRIFFNVKSFTLECNQLQDSTRPFSSLTNSNHSWQSSGGFLALVKIWQFSGGSLAFFSQFE